MKKLLGIVILLGVGSMLFMQNDVMAQGTVEDAQIKQMSEVNDLFTSLSSAIYALLWPVLFVAGIALDNRLVYGGFLHLDASLWMLWNIMKNFANFALGFMVLFAIVRNIFTAPFGKSGDKRGPISIIKKTLIAGIMIQASWFIMAAVIDVSTILTYSIGGLPMTVMQNSPDQANLPILGISANLNTRGDNKKMNLNYYNTYGDFKISNCDTRKIPGLTGTYIVGRKDIKVDNETYFYTGLCTLGSWPYRYVENPAFTQTGNEGYHSFLNSYFGSGTELTGDAFKELESGCNIIPTEFSKLSSVCSGQNYGILKKDDKFFKKTQDSNSTGIAYTIDTLLDKSKGFVGPFITIYSSLLDFSTITSAPAGDAVLSDFLELIIKLFFAAVLFFPLVALAVVLIARVGLLWIIIAASPIMVLLAVFKDVFNIKSSSDGFMGNFSGPNIIKLIFAPVFVVFAISMSMIFLSALNPKGISKDQGPTDQQMSELGMEKIDDKTYSILGLVEITLDVNKVNKGMDMFAWFITMFFSTGIIRFFLFFAIRMTKIGESVGKGIQESMQNLAKNLPIIPVAGGIGINAAKQGMKDLSNKIPTAMNAKQMQDLKEKYPWLYGPTGDENRGGENYSLSKVSTNLQTKIITELASGKKIDQVYDDLDIADKAELTKAGIVNSASLNTSYNYINNFASSLTGKDDEKGINTFAAEKYDSGTISMWANQSSSKRHDRAKGAVGSNVKTADGKVYVMANVGTYSNPEFKLLDQKDYADEYLGKTGDGKVDESKIRAVIEADFRKEEKPEDKDEKERKDIMKARIDEEVKLHMKHADERQGIKETVAKTSNKYANGTSQVNEGTDETVEGTDASTDGGKDKQPE